MTSDENRVQLGDEARAAISAAKDVALRGESYSIATAADFDGAATQLQEIKGAAGRLDEMRKGMTRPLDESKRKIMDLFRVPLDKLADAERRIKRAMADFNREQERLRIEQQRKADEAARKERERLEARARRADAAGKAEKAEELARKAEMVVAPIVSRPVPAARGISKRSVWRYEIVDRDLVPDEFYVIDERRIADRVRSLKADAKIPGVRVWEDNTIAARSAG